jgi:hypothetical protein
MTVHGWCAVPVISLGKQQVKPAFLAGAGIN